LKKAKKLGMKEYQKVERQKRDKNAGSYDQWFSIYLGGLFDRYERELFISVVKSNSPDTVLDIGCGTGRITEAIAPFVQRIVAVDVSSKSLQMLHRREIPNCSALCATADSLPVKGEFFDLAVSCQVLPILRGEELLSTLKEVNRALRPGSAFFFSAYNYHYWRYKWLVRQTTTGESYKNSFSSGFVHELAKKSDFEVIKVGYYKALPLRFLKREQWITVDRFLCSVPAFGRIASGYLVAILQKR
jgi:ubiquinone/menaquinone biosynthesis C-methylase UbiE